MTSGKRPQASPQVSGPLRWSGRLLDSPHNPWAVGSSPTRPTPLELLAPQCWPSIGRRQAGGRRSRRSAAAPRREAERRRKGPPAPGRAPPSRLADSRGVGRRPQRRSGRCVEPVASALTTVRPGPSSASASSSNRARSMYCGRAARQRRACPAAVPQPAQAVSPSQAAEDPAVAVEQLLVGRSGHHATITVRREFAGPSRKVDPGGEPGGPARRPGWPTCQRALSSDARRVRRIIVKRGKRCCRAVAGPLARAVPPVSEAGTDEEDHDGEPAGVAPRVFYLLSTRRRHPAPSGRATRRGYGALRCCRTSRFSEAELLDTFRRGRASRPHRRCPG